MYKGGSIEKRNFPRLDCSMPVQYKQIGTVEDETNKVITKDISEGGTRIVVDEYVPVNSRLALVLFFPFKNKKVKAFTKVVWSKRHSVLTRYDLGVEFLGITISAREAIAQFVKTKLS